mgnify:CR=1 FL=1
MSEKRNIIFFIIIIVMSLFYWTSSKLLIGDKPIIILELEDKQNNLNENLISAQILASQLDRVYTLFQENLALSQADSLADDASLPFLNGLTDILNSLEIELLAIKPRDRNKKGNYFKVPYELTIQCSYKQFGEFLAEMERSPRLIMIDEFEVKNGYERIRSRTNEEELSLQEFIVKLSTITLVKSNVKVS